MSLSWPWALLALLAIPLVVAAWWWTRRRRRRGAVRVTSIALVHAALPGRNRWRRLIPAALLLLGLAVLGVGAARPQATVHVPSSSGTIMLALHVSGSMCSTYLSPNRPPAARHPRRARLHDRVRHHQPRAPGVQQLAVRRVRRGRIRRRVWRAQPPRRRPRRPPADRQHHRRQVLPSGERRPAQGRSRQPLR